MLVHGTELPYDCDVPYSNSQVVISGPPERSTWPVTTASV